MSALLLHVQDTGVALYEGASLLASSPGIAVLGAGDAKFGHEAIEHFRLQPRWLQTRFWQDMSEKECLSEAGESWSYAELASEHAGRLVHEAGAADRDVIIALPAHYDADALALLLGVIKSTALNPVGLIDTAVLECGQISDTLPSAHLDIHLNQAIVTRLSSGSGVEKVDSEILAEMGWSQIIGDWSEWFARRFVEETRFDPHHSPDAEQKLFDQLRHLHLQPVSENRRLSLEAGSKTFSLDVSAETLRQAAQPTLEKLAGALSGFESVAISAAATAVPGLKEALSKVTQVVALSPNALASAFDRYRDSLTTGEDRLAVTEALSPVSSSTAPKHAVTHLLVGGHAWPIGAGLSIVEERGHIGVTVFDGKGIRIWQTGGETRIDPQTADGLSLDGRPLTETETLEPGMELTLTGCQGKIIAVHELSHGA